jgi:hypothetical protein
VGSKATLKHTHPHQHTHTHTKKEHVQASQLRSTPTKRNNMNSRRQTPIHGEKERARDNNSVWEDEKRMVRRAEGGNTHKSELHVRCREATHITPEHPRTETHGGNDSESSVLRGQPLRSCQHPLLLPLSLFAAPEEERVA